MWVGLKHTTMFNTCFMVHVVYGHQTWPLARTCCLGLWLWWRWTQSLQTLRSSENGFARSLASRDWEICGWMCLGEIYAR